MDDKPEEKTSVAEAVRAGVAQGKERLAGKPSAAVFDAPVAGWCAIHESYKECEHAVLGTLPWRVGTKVGRTIYDARDRLIGTMDTRELAAAVVRAVNASLIGGP
jgi:hypothetical protein